jgi:hypothetical protein
MILMLNYIPTLQQQNPQSGGNLSTIIKTLQGGTNTNPLQNQNPYQGLSDVSDQIAGALKPQSTFGGFNYQNYIPDLSGSQTAQAAQAGVQSGLQFNPLTGEVG